MNNKDKKDKPRLNMTTKSLLRKQVIIPINSYNSGKMMDKANTHVMNINRLLKRVKSKCSADFIHTDNKELLITMNKVAVISDLNIIKKYIKDLNDVDYNNIKSPRLSQSKSYLKILSIPYFVEKTNLSISSNIIEKVIKSTYIINNILDSQSSSNTKMLINRCFNIRSHITTIHRTNMKYPQLNI